MADAYDYFPQSIMTSIPQPLSNPVAGGGFADVFKVRLGDQVVAVKHFRCVADPEGRKTRRVTGDP
jgi:hypothetical protein